MDKIVKTNEEWRKTLTPEQYKILREKGTELAFTGKLLDVKKAGKYKCAGCGNLLFLSENKYDSGTGWPSFYESAGKDSVELKKDRILFISRTEVICSKCGGHLGHVFDDGPPPTGKRYCINSLVLNFDEEK